MDLYVNPSGFFSGGAIGTIFWDEKLLIYLDLDFMLLLFTFLIDSYSSSI